MNYDPECRKATRRKINVVLPACIYKRGASAGRVHAGTVGKSLPAAPDAIRGGSGVGGGGV